MREIRACSLNRGRLNSGSLSMKFLSGKQQESHFPYSTGNFLPAVKFFVLYHIMLAGKIILVISPVFISPENCCQDTLVLCSESFFCHIANTSNTLLIPPQIKRMRKRKKQKKQSPKLKPNIKCP